MTKPLRDRLNDALASVSKADRALANFMMTELAALPFETAASIAKKVGLSEPTVGRFCRGLGYKSFKDLKNHLKQDIGDQPWLISDRLRELRERASAGEDQLATGLEMEMAALVAVYEIAQSPEWKTVVKRLATARSVYAAGFQTERGMAQVFANQLQYLRPRVHLLDLSGGNFAEFLAEDTSDAALVLFEARRYSKLAQHLAEDARACGVPVTLITDPYCDWGRTLATETFVVPTQVGLFWESTAQMASLANLIVNSVFLELGPEVEARMHEITRLYGQFTGHVEGPASQPSGILRRP